MVKAMNLGCGWNGMMHYIIMESWIGGAMKGILVNNGLECLEELIYFPTFQCQVD